MLLRIGYRLRSARQFGSQGFDVRAMAIAHLMPHYPFCQFVEGEWPEEIQTSHSGLAPTNDRLSALEAIENNGHFLSRPDKGRQNLQAALGDILDFSTMGSSLDHELARAV